MPLELTHYGDYNTAGTHVICLVDRDNTTKMLKPIDMFNIKGCGTTYEKALEDLKQQFDRQKLKLDIFEKMLFETDAIVPIEVNSFGMPIDSKVEFH